MEEIMMKNIWEIENHPLFSSAASGSSSNRKSSNN
jgi:hypothetical protein